MIAKSYGYVYVAHERNCQWPFRYGHQPGPVLLPNDTRAGGSRGGALCGGNTAEIKIKRSEQRHQGGFYSPFPSVTIESPLDFLHIPRPVALTSPLSEKWRLFGARLTGPLDLLVCYAPAISRRPRTPLISIK